MENEAITGNYSEIRGEPTLEIRREATGDNSLLEERESKAARAMILLFWLQLLRFFGGSGT